MRSSRRILLAVSVISALVGAGCTSTPEPAPGPPPATTTVSEAATRLGLEVVEESTNRARLRNGSNHVRIFGPPSRWIFVNRRKLGPVEGLQVIDGALRLPDSAIEMIREELSPVRGPWNSPLTPPPSPPPAPPPEAPPAAPAPPPPVTVKDLAGQKLVLDPGHGGKDPGALGPHGYHEKSVNLSVAQRLQALLEKRGAQVTLTRTGDRFISLEGRAELSNRLKPRVFVSLHSDASTNRRARGYTIYVARKASKASIRLANHLDAAMAATGLARRGVKRADFRVLVKTSCPAALVEMGFISNAAEAALLADSGFRDRIARALASGIGRALATLR